MKTRTKAYIYLLIVSILWGTAGPILKYGLTYFSPFLFLSYRFLISSIIAVILFSIKKPHIPKNPKKQALILIYGFLMTTGVLSLFFLGFDKTSSIAGSFISSLSPIIASILGAVMLHEHFTKKEQKGVLIAFIGLLFVVTEPLITGNGKLDSSIVGNLIIMAAVTLDVLMAIMSKYILRDKTTPIDLTNIAFIIGLITMVPLALVTTTPDQIIHAFTTAPLSAHLSVFFMAVLSGTVAFTFWYKGLKTIEIGDASIFGYLKPLWAAPLAIFWLKESISYPFVIGIAMTIIGVIIAETKKRK